MRGSIETGENSPVVVAPCRATESRRDEERYGRLVAPLLVDRPDVTPLVTSAMIGSANVRWDLRVETYGTEAALAATLRRFAGAIMHRERRGDLDRPA